jgi:hypothetical protein
MWEEQEMRNACRNLAGDHMVGVFHMEDREGPSNLGEQVLMTEARESNPLAIFVISDAESFRFVICIVL